MEKENLIWLKDFVKYRTINPFEDNLHEKSDLERLRDEALESIKRYKYLKDSIQSRKKERLVIDNVINSLQKDINNYDN
jgi:hypothetical protein